MFASKVLETEIRQMAGAKDFLNVAAFPLFISTSFQREISRFKCIWKNKGPVVGRWVGGG